MEISSGKGQRAYKVLIQIGRDISPLQTEMLDAERVIELSPTESNNRPYQVGLAHQRILWLLGASRL